MFRRMSILLFLLIGLFFGYTGIAFAAVPFPFTEDFETNPFAQGRWKNHGEPFVWVGGEEGKGALLSPTNVGTYDYDMSCSIEVTGIPQSGKIELRWANYITAMTTNWAHLIYIGSTPLTSGGNYDMCTFGLNTNQLGVYDKFGWHSNLGTVPHGKWIYHRVVFDQDDGSRFDYYVTVEGEEELVFEEGQPGKKLGSDPTFFSTNPFTAFQYLLDDFALIRAGSVEAAAAEHKSNPDLTGHELLQFEGMYGDQAKKLQFKRKNKGNKIEYIRQDIPEFKIPPYEGERYTAMVPDTLDLAERCALAVECLTGLTDPELDYDTYFSGGPPHCFSDICGVKFQEALPLMRIASGSTKNMQVDRAWMESQLKSIGPDGLFYINRPYLPDENMTGWVQQVATPEGPKPLLSLELDQFCETVVQGRMLGVFTIYYLRDKNPMWIDVLNNSVEGIREHMVIDKGDYAYMPYRVVEPNAKLPEDAPMPLDMGAEELGGRFIQGLAQYYKVSGYEPARVLNEKLVNYMRYHSHYFDEEGRFTQTGPNNTLIVRGGHFHAHALSILNFLDHALAVNDRELMDFVKRSYEWARENTYSSTLAGWFPELVRPEHTWSEPCCPADMIALAVKLSEAEIGDYWDDVDRWIRNYLIEVQTKGGGWGPGCCTGNATRALYYAWENILDCEEGRLTVNVLLNRSSHWADIDSHVPYQGRVDVKIKQPLKEIRLRAPEWIQTGSSDLVCLKGSREIEAKWDGRYVNLGSGKPGEIYSITFPISERRLTERMANNDFELIVKGNTIVSLEPDGVMYMPPFDRQHYRENQTRWVKKERFVARNTIDW